MALAAAAVGPTVCGHQTGQTITYHEDGGERWCGDCHSTYASLRDRFQRGEIDRDALAIGLHDLIATFPDSREGGRPVGPDAEAAVAAAVADIEDWCRTAPLTEKT